MFPAVDFKHLNTNMMTKHYEQVCPLCITSHWPKHRAEADYRLAPKTAPSPTAHVQFPVPPQSKTTQKSGSSLMKWVSSIQSQTSI